MAGGGIIFDLDDTLIETTRYFNEAKERFRVLMEREGFPGEEAVKKLNEFDIANVKKMGGFMKECFPRALGQTYEYFCSLYRRTPDPQKKEEVERLGWELFTREIELVEGAEEVLKELAKAYPLYLATKGDPQLQLAKVKASGLARYFRRVYIFRVKRTAEYLYLARDADLAVMESWIIGNSMKGDINPGIRGGFNCIHFDHPHTWDFEEEPPVGDFYRVTSLFEVLEIIGGEKRRLLLAEG